MTGLIDLLEGILMSIINKGEVEISEIQRRFDLTKETTDKNISFLVRFGFAELDRNKRYVRPSPTSIEFFE